MSRLARRPSLAAPLLLCALLVRPPTAAAWIAGASFRCGARLVGAGQSIDEVYGLCGEPTERATATEFVTVHLRCDVDVTRPVALERWTYDRGPKRFVRFLTFRDGVLVDVAEGPYGR